MAGSPLKRSVKFVASDQDGMPVKRRQAQQACDLCRQKKKRCSHGSDGTGVPFLKDNSPAQGRRQRSGSNNQETPVSRDPAPRRLPPSPESLEQPGDEADEGPYSTGQAAAQSIELSRSRFVGDMIPESIFIEAASKSVVGSSLYRAPSDVGAWLPRSARQPDEEHEQPPRPKGGTRHGSTGPAMADDGPASLHTLSGHLSRPYNAHDPTGEDSLARQLAVCPPEREYQKLQGIYLECIHPMLPVLSETDIHETLNPRTVKHSMFRQVVAFAAAVEDKARRWLRLDANGPRHVPFQTFHQLLSKAIFSSLDANALVDRVDHIRVLLIMSFFYQPVRATERDLPSLIFSQAVHYAQSLGIHLLGYSAPERDTRSKDAEGLFCALWALDRINAAFNGLPCLIHERDTDRDLDKCIAAQEQPAFRLFLKVAMMLDRVICLYRPCNKGEETVELPIYESMIMDAGAEKLPTRLHATLEIFYHYVAVLSCRQPLSAFAPTAPAQAHLPHPSINARRSLSADRIVDSVQSTLTRSLPDRVGLLPFVPYAVALSLSVAYRKMRYSKVPMYRMRGKARFEQIVQMLKELGEVYTCARVNAGLGEAILREMDKTAKELASSSAAAAAANSAAPSPGRRRASAETVSGSTRNTLVVGGGDEQQGTANITHSSSGLSQIGEGALHMPPASAAQQAGAEVFASAPVYDEVATGRQQVGDMGALPSSSFGEDLDVDLFGHFDPEFDLNAVDVALEANLDMGFPQTWTAQWPE